jgi:hypothetical protein
VQNSAGSGASSSGNCVGGQRLDLLIKLVSRFDPSDLHLFFTSFEREALLNVIHGRRPREDSSGGSRTYFFFWGGG